MKGLALIAFILFFSACKHDTYENRNLRLSRPAYTVTMVPTSTFNLLLNDSTVITENIQYFDDGSNKLVVLANYNNTSLEFYDLASKAFKFNSNFEGEVKKPSGFYVHSLDSIFIYSDAEKKIYLTDLRQVKRVYDIRKATKNPLVVSCSPILNASNPFYIVGNSLIYSGFKVGEKSSEKARFYAAKLNLETGEVTEMSNYPTIYKQHNWGGVDFRIPYVTYNPYTNSYVGSLPAAHFLCATNLKTGFVTNIEASSKYIETLPPLDVPFHELDVTEDKAKITRYYSSSWAYRNIIYDKYRDLYYRVIEYPSDDKDIDKEGNSDKGMGLIIMDGKFNILGETKLPHGTSVWTYFVSQDGLCLLDYTNKDENYAKFHVYSIKKI
jgi:hypothetical protein